MTPLPSEVDDVLGTYLRLADEDAPGLVEGFYLVGSVALGEFRPHASDIDFVAVVSDADPAALDRVHTRLRARHRRPVLDGFYVSWADLRRDPARAIPGPRVHEGRLRAAPEARDPVAWHTLAQCGIRIRGPKVTTLGVWTNDVVLRRWVLENLDTYWGRLRRRNSLLGLTPQAVAYCVPGLARMHRTLATGEIVGKEGGARHALRAFGPQWHQIVEESLRLLTRSGNRSLYRTPYGRRKDLLGFWDELYADAQRRGADLAG